MSNPKVYYYIPNPNIKITILYLFNVVYIPTCHSLIWVKHVKVNQGSITIRYHSGWYHTSG